MNSAILLSLQVGLLCALLGAPPAILMGYGLARRAFRGKALVSTLLLAPLVTPPVVTGYLLLKAFGRSSPWGAWLDAHGVHIAFGFWGAVLAALVMGLPLYVTAIRAAFEAVDPRLEEVAASSGLRPWAVFRRVTLPLAWPGVLAGAVLAFARALGEFGATIVLAGNLEGETRTIPLALYSLLESPNGDSQARPLLLGSLLLAFGALATHEVLLRRQRRGLELHG